MATLTIEVPEDLLTELHQRQIPDKLLELLVVRTIESLVEARPEISAEKIAQWLDEPAALAAESLSSPFAKSALPFIEQLLDENQTLFERLAKM
ncbi:MAG: hypothetical protein L6R45_26745 [Anaerolineae bacterium]|nr:hypothetical protein [Anaerolineae bacterium]